MFQIVDLHLVRDRVHVDARTGNLVGVVPTRRRWLAVVIWVGLTPLDVGASLYGELLKGTRCGGRGRGKPVHEGSEQDRDHGNHATPDDPRPLRFPKPCFPLGREGRFLTGAGPADALLDRCNRRVCHRGARHASVSRCTCTSQQAGSTGRNVPPDAMEADWILATIGCSGVISYPLE